MYIPFSSLYGSVSPSPSPLLLLTPIVLLSQRPALAHSRTAPSGYVPAGAFPSAVKAASALPVRGSASWSEVTKKPFQGGDQNYDDPLIGGTGGYGFNTGYSTYR